MSNVRSDKPFILAGRTYQSRLLVGTGKYRDLEKTRLAIEASGAEIVTVAVRRTNIGQNPGEPNLLDVLPPDRYTILPNTAGCYDAVEAVRTCRLARELLDGHKLVKLEVLADQKTLFPNVIETLKAAEILVKDGFDVMVYTSDDPIIARQLAEIGCIAVIQVVVHLVYFLHMDRSPEQRNSVAALIFSALVIVLLVGLSLWIMFRDRKSVV